MLLVGVAAALATAAAVFFLRKRRKEPQEKPPKNAPQVDIKNPGEQSEFTTTASESEIG